MYSYIFRREQKNEKMRNTKMTVLRVWDFLVHIWEKSSISTLKFQLKSNKNPGYFCFIKWKMTTFLSKSVKLTLEAENMNIETVKR